MTPEPLSRRRVLGLAAGFGVAGAGLAAGVAGVAGVAGCAVGGSAARTADSAGKANPGMPDANPATATVRIPRPHQAGIAERPGAHLRLIAFDLTGGRPGLIRVLTAFAKLTEELTTGATPTGTVVTPATGLAPASLTVTVGVGASLLTKAGLPVPPALAPLPPFPGDALDPRFCDGDLVVQLCAEDPMVATAAAQAFRAAVTESARVRWVQNGFRNTAAAHRGGTGRNLFGQIDGTNNPAVGSGLFDTTVWVRPGRDVPWMVGGSYLVARRIRMDLNAWSHVPATHQERVVGRRLDSGAPLTGRTETDPPDLLARDPAGQYAIPADAHIRLASPATNRGARMFRRGYSYDDGLLQDGRADAGLIFLAYQADPHAAFIPVQRSLAGHDALTRFTSHVGSAVFAVPPAPAPGRYLLQGILGS